MEGKFTKTNPEKRKRRRRLRGGVLAFLLATALLLAAATALGLGDAYHLRLTVDTERISPTFSGADLRADFNLLPQLSALSMDEDFSLPSLLREDSIIGQRLTQTKAVTNTVQDLLAYLGSYDARFGSEYGLVEGAQHILRMAENAKIAVFCGGGVLLLVLALFLWKLIAARALPAFAFGGLAALLLGLLPPTVLWGAMLLRERVQTALSAVSRYGVGVSARLTLTGVGKAQMLLAAAALFTVAGGLFLLRLRKKAKKRAPIREIPGG